MKRALPVALLSLFLLLSCGESEPTPEQLIPEDTYVDLLVELQLLNTYRGSLPDSLRTDTLRPAIFERYGVSAETFERSHRYYRQQLDAQKRRIDEAIERLRRDQVRESGGEAQDSVQR